MNHLPMHEMKNIAFCALLVLAAGCSSLQGPAPKAVFDFGPEPLAAAPAAGTRPPVALAEMDAGAALDGTSVLYRLAYADARQLQPYTLARWSMAPAQLVRQRLRDALGQAGPVLNAGEGNTPLVLRVELEEFSQLFSAPDKSAGLVRLRATLTRNESLLAQRSFVIQRPAASPDAPGGVHALAAATDAAVAEVNVWLGQTLQAGR